MTPLDLRAELRIAVDPAMTAEQQYDALLDLYTPDYMVVPLTVWPEVSVAYSDLDPTATPPTSDEEVAKLDPGSVKWYYIDASGVEQPLPTESSDYNDTVPGCPHAYALQIKRNILTTAPLVLLLRATYVDGTTQKPLSATLSISSVAVSDPLPKLSLSVPAVLIHNPLTDNDTFPVQAELLQGGRQLTAGTDYRLCWEMYDHASGTWYEADPDEISGAEIRTLTDNGTKAVLNMMLMANDTRFRVRAAFKRTDGSWFGDSHAEPTAVAASDALAPEAYFTVFRDCGKLDMVPVFMPSTYTGSADKLRFRVDISCGGTIIDEPEEELDIVWRYGVPGSDGNVPDTATEVGRGRQVDVPVSMFESGKELGVSAVLKAPYAILVENDGTVLADNTGAWLITR